MHHSDRFRNTGCIVVNPPHFLSEEEALEVIVSELDRVGVRLTERDTVLDDVQTPRRVTRYEKDADGAFDRRRTKIVKVPGDAHPLSMDASDPARRIGIEYVSRQEYFKRGGADSGSTVQSYNFRAPRRWTVTERFHDAVGDHSEVIGVVPDKVAVFDTPYLPARSPGLLEGLIPAVP